MTNIRMFVLATIAVSLATLIPAHAPRTTPTGPRSASPLKLALDVVILDGGFAVSAFGHRVGPGCEAEGAGLAVEASDYAGLRACLQKIKALSPELAVEHEVTLAANSDVRYQTVIDTIDAVRRTDSGEDLFPDVYFGVVR